MSGFIASVQCGRQYASNIFSIPGFHLSYIQPDWMHTVCLGILQDLAGNTMWELFETVGGTFARHLEACSTPKNMIDI
eukprot:3566901-Pyramimonas_sp.AAC.1